MVYSGTNKICAKSSTEEITVDVYDWQYSPLILLYLLAIPVFYAIMLHFYYKQKTIAVTHPTIIWWRVVIGIIFVAGIIYGILQILLTPSTTTPNGWGLHT